ncbi:MAG: hypothetical protein KF850_19945 [Labilithrix sp.]|nr:hypothetical protein [Labilithrix sp.]MBX3214317.1 hypothetical protein [Labilithrix sp.]
MGWATLIGSAAALVSCGGATSKAKGEGNFNAAVERSCSSVDTIQECERLEARLASDVMSCNKGAGPSQERCSRARERRREVASALKQLRRDAQERASAEARASEDARIAEANTMRAEEERARQEELEARKQATAEEEARRKEERTLKARQCLASNPAPISGLEAGTYAGQAAQTVKAKGGTVFEWMSLQITVDANGCATWRGFEGGDIAMQGDVERNIEKVSSTCINEGEATIVNEGKGFRLKGSILRKYSGGTPTRFHIWSCPGGRKIRTDMKTSLASDGCQRIGNGADPTEERGAAIACAYSQPFAELKDRTFTVQKDGTIRLPFTVAEPTTIVLHRIDSKQ